MEKLLQGATPFYLQIEAILRDQIASGDLRPGDLVATEKTLCDQYGVSRPTVRQAIKNLEIDGLIVRNRGKGTRVTARPEEKILPLIDLRSTDLVDVSDVEKIELGRAGFCISPPAVRAEFRLEEPLEVFSIVRIFLKDEIPFLASKIFLRKETAKLLVDSDFLEKHFLDILAKRCNKSITRSEQKIESILAEPIMADFLKIAPGTPLLSVHRTSFDEDNSPIEHCHRLIRTDRCKLNLSMHRDQGKNWQVS